MHIHTRNVNTAFVDLVKLFSTGEYNTSYWTYTPPITRRPSRNGEVLVIEEPVTITYEQPRERVLFNAARDANPFFHLYEALWMLAGRNDVAPLAYYVKDFAKFSDDGKTLNGAYGYRWRHARDDRTVLSYSAGDELDQLDIIANHLRADPNSRRAVLQMWNVEDDLLNIGVKCEECLGTGYHRYPDFDSGRPNLSDSAPCSVCKGTAYMQAGSKDVCCNLSVMFSLRDTSQGLVWAEHGPQGQQGKPIAPTVLDMTVTNRSNDLVWGLLGANYVHFTILQEYMAARLGVQVGRYHHFTNNLHAYSWNFKPTEWLGDEPYGSGYFSYESPNVGNTADAVRNWGEDLQPMPLVQDPAAFDKEAMALTTIFDGTRQDQGGRYQPPSEPFLLNVVWPMLSAHYAYKRLDIKTALEFCAQIKAADWRITAEQWLLRRVK